MKTTPDLSNAQLFLDDEWVEQTYFVSRQWHQPRRFPDPVLVAEHPWERWAVTMYGTVHHWRSKFRMWYVVWTRESKNRVCYAESDDGVAWTKPHLGLCEFNGSRDNNIVIDGTRPDRYVDDISVIDDPDDEEWPLKALYWEGSGHDESKIDWGIWLARSKDGIKWDRSPGLVLPGWIDRFNAISSKVDGKYVLLGRAPPVGKNFFRRVWRIESTDLRTWSEPRLVLARDLEDPPNMEYYSAVAFPYEGILVGGLERMYMTPDVLDTELIWSRDNGYTWGRARTRPAFLAPLRDVGPRFDNTWVSLPTNAPIRRHNRLWFYYTGRSCGHGVKYPMNHAAIGLSTLRVDGFASLHARERHGWVLTKPMTWPNAELYVNGETRREFDSHPGFCTGDLRVEIRDEANQPIPGYTWDDCLSLWQSLEQPEASAPIVFKDNRSTRALAARRVRLAFRLHEAHLYSFRAKA